MPTQKSLAEQVQLDENWELSLENIALLLGAIEARIRTIEIKSADFDVVRDQVLGVLLARINEVLTPQINAISNIVNMGFLIAYSDSSAALAPGNVLPFTIEDEEQRMVFTPSPRVSLSRVANYTDYAIAQVSDWNRETGELVVVVEAAWGNPGPFTDWVIAALPGDTLAAIQAADEAITAMNLSKDWAEKANGVDVDGAGTRSAKHHANAALGSSNTATGARDTTLTARDVTLTARDATLAARDISITKAAEAAASAASISGGPVTSINYKTGVAFTDPTKVTDVPPTLDLDFTNSNGAPFFDFLSRPSVGGYRRNSKGILVPTTFDEPLIDRTIFQPKGTGFFGAYSNLALWSEDFSNAVWSKTSTTVTPNVTVAPDGNTTADTLTDTNASGDAYCRQSFTVANDSATYTASVFLKQGTAATSRLSLTLTGGTLVLQDAVINWSTGAITGANASVEDAPNGFKRLSVKITNNASGNTTLLMDIRASGDATGVETGNAGAWGAQLTATAFPVPYMPTTSAAAARSADSMIITGSDFTDWFNPVEGTLLLGAYVPRGSGFQKIVQIDDGTDNNRHAFDYNAGGGVLRGFTVVGTTDQAVMTTAVSAGALFNAAFSYKANSFNYSLNGSVVAADTSGSVPSSLTRLVINADGTFNEHIRRLIYWPQALTAIDLQRMTQ